MSTNFFEAKAAIKEAIIFKNYEAIDDAIDDRINNLTQVSHSKTPIFAAVEEVMIDSQHLPESERHHVAELILDGLSYIFDKVEQKLASADKSDKELLKMFVHHSCNHISHSSFLPIGGTVRDVLEEYTSVDYCERPYDKAYLDVYKFIKKYGLETKKEVAQENIVDKASHGKGR
jgi:hypothetical protein